MLASSTRNWTMLDWLLFTASIGVVAAVLIGLL
jgi:hypothetical protein